MTVKQLKDKIKNLPDKMVVTIENNSVWVDGTYVATDVEIYAIDNTVCIASNYESKLGAENCNDCDPMDE